MNPSSKSALSTINIIYFSLMIMMTLFGAVVFFLNSSGGIDSDPELTLLFRYVLCGLLPVGLGSGYFIFKQIVNSINSSLPIQEKLMKYQTAVLVRSACFEMPGLVGVVSALISGDNSFLLFTAIIIVLFLIVRPSTYTISSDLNLSQSERALLEDPASMP